MPIIARLTNFFRRLSLSLRIQLDQRYLSVRRPNTVWLPLRGSLPEHEIFRAGTLGLLPRRRTLLRLLSALASLADQSRVTTVVLTIGRLGGGLARVQNLADNVRRIRENKIKVIALLEHGASMREYLIALQADEIVLPPAQTLELVGLRSEYLLARGLLDKLAVEPEVLAVGKYKSAGEMLERTQLSDEAREMAEQLVDDTYDVLCRTLAERRGIDLERAAELLGNGPYRPQTALESGLIDAVLYPDELRSRLKGEGSRNIPAPRLLAALQRPRALRALGSNQRLAIVYASGQILTRSPGPLSDPAITPRAFAKIFKALRRDRNVRGVVLRVSSPGGSATASDIIWREAQLLAEKKPLVASFGDVAASGGYYIAMGARRIFAEPSSLTGSIGVVGGKLNLSGLYQKLGINKELITRGDNAWLYSDFVGLDERSREKLMELMRETYRDFVEKAAQGRGMQYEQIDQLAQGRVYTGSRALEVGLVDELGGLDDAVRHLKGLCNVPEEQPILIQEFPRPKTVKEMLRLSREDMRLSADLPEFVRRALARLSVFEHEPVATLCLFEPPEG
ncbi:MAG: signal peptide peptidase SppA [Candidatus Alcyoniella australis]|nr:signal peptide peptidase SppA [Candidatus Alcyoniella australis]